MIQCCSIYSQCVQIHFPCRAYDYLSKNPIPRGWTHIAIQEPFGPWVIINPANYPHLPTDGILTHPGLQSSCNVPTSDHVTVTDAPPEVYYDFVLPFEWK